MIWYLTDQWRFRAEREAIDQLLARAPWLSPAGGWSIGDGVRITWQGDIKVGDTIRPIVLRYPQHFPHSPPLVLPRGGTSQWSGHQWGPGGELCLEYGTDNWHSAITGADMLESAYRLLQGEEPGGEDTSVTSRHDVTLGQTLRSDWFCLYATKEFEEAVRLIPEGTVLSAKAIRWLHDEACILAITSFAHGNETWIQPGIPEPLKLELYEPHVALFRIPPSIWIGTTDLTDFKALLASAGIALPDHTYAVALRGDQATGYYLNPNKDSVTRFGYIPPQEPVDRLDPSHSALSGRSVVIVGCGSLGSKIAASLARAGVGTFLLVDDDILFPDNLVRHDLDWREIGTHKVDSVARRIKLINPAADVTVRRHRLGGQETSNSLEFLIKNFEASDLMIDATADPKVFNYLCAAVATGKKPLIWAEVFGGGVGGLLARHRPGLDPAPDDTRAIIESWCADKLPGSERRHAAGGYDGTADDGTPMIADDADVSVIAAHATRMAIDLLLPRLPSAFPYSAYMIGLANSLFFDAPFDTQPIELPAPSVVEKAKLSPEAQAQEKQFLGQLFKKFTDENSSD
jgi:ThiF family